MKQKGIQTERMTKFFKLYFNLIKFITQEENCFLSNKLHILSRILLDKLTNS